MDQTSYQTYQIFRDELGLEAEPNSLDEEFEQIPTAITPWPTMAPEAFHGVMGDLVKLIEPHSESDPVALLVQGLVMFGNIIGRNRYFEADGARHYLNLYAVLVGVTSKGRKGTSWSQCLKPFSALDEHWAKECIKGGLSSGEGLIWAVRDPIYRTEAVKENKIVTGYQEVQIDSGISDKRLLVLAPEFASILKVIGRAENTLSDTIRQGWDSGTLRILTKNSPAKATGAHISIIGHITKQELLRHLDTAEAANGFANRFLWLSVKRSKSLPDGGELGKENFEPVLKALSRAVQYASTECEIKRDLKAKEVWHAVYDALSEGQPGLFGSITSRAEAQVMRLACVYALLDCSDEIRPEHLQAALAVWSYCEESAKYIFGDSLGDAVADTILNSLRVHPEGMTKTQINDLFRRNRTKQEIDRALGVLVETKKARCESVETGGRSSEVWFAIS